MRYEIFIDEERGDILICNELTGEVIDDIEEIRFIYNMLGMEITQQEMRNGSL